MKKRLQKKAEKIKQTAVKAAENMQETAEKVMDKVVEEAPVVAKTISSKTEEIMNSPVVKEVKKTIRTRVSEVNLEIFETSVSISAIEKAVKKAVSAKKLKGEIKIYINAEQRMAYYTVNGEGSEEFKIDLKSL